MRFVRVALGLLVVLALMTSGAAPVAAQAEDEDQGDHRPDLLVAETDKQLPNRARFVKPDEFVGDDVYEAPLGTDEDGEEGDGDEGEDGEEDGDLEQMVLLEVDNGKHIFILKVENDGAEPDTYSLRYEDGSGEPGYNARLFLASEDTNNKVRKERPVNTPATSEEGFTFDLYPVGSEEGPSEQLFWLELRVRAGFPAQGRVEEFPILVESLGGQEAASRVGSMVDRLLAGEDAIVDHVLIQLGEEREEDDGDQRGGDGADEISWSQITITDPTAADVSNWPITRELQVQIFANGNQTWSANSVAGWIGVEFFNPGKPLAGNMWFVRRVGADRWQAAPLEWIFQGMTRQFMTDQIIRDHALLGSGWGPWAPAPGEEIGFFLTTPAWGPNRTPSGMQRTPVVRVNWGCQGNC